MRWLLELIILMIIGGLVLQWLIGIVEPIAPYVIGTVVFVAVGVFVGKIIFARLTRW